MRLTPEAELVLRSAKVADDSRWRTLCAQPLHWENVVALAADERAALVLFQKLPDEAPSEAKAALRKLSLVAEFRLARLDKLFDMTLTSLEQSGIEAMLLKGGALVARGIARLSERPMNDIDLLVAAEQAQDAWEHLQGAGWRWDRDRFPAHLYERQHHLPPLVDAGGSSYRLEIHRDLFRPGHPFSLSGTDVWASSEIVTFGAHRVRVPNLYHSLVHAAIHFTWSHAFASKAWRTLRDVELVVGRTALDWESLTLAAQRARAASCTYWTLRMAHAAIGTQVPDRALARMRPPRPEVLLRRLERHYASNMTLSGAPCPSGRLNRALWEAGMCPGHQEHGTVRPWDGNFSIPEVEAWERERGRIRLTGRLRQARHLARYLWDLL